MTPGIDERSKLHILKTVLSDVYFVMEALKEEGRTKAANAMAEAHERLVRAVTATVEDGARGNSGKDSSRKPGRKAVP